MGNKKLEIFDLREKGYNLQDNIFAAFSNDTLVFPDDGDKRNFNSTLSNPIQNWAKEIPNMQPKVFLTTYLTVCKKSANTDIENLLFYNLNSKKDLNKILKSNQLEKIIIQGMDKISSYWSQSLAEAVKPDLYRHYYFYGVFNNNMEYTKYILYDDCNCGTNLFLDICDYLKLFAATRNKRQILNQISQNYLDKLKPKKHIVPLNTKFYLKIKINSNFFPETVDNLKKLIDVIVVFCNKICIIETDKPRVNGNGYNPTDDLLYYCEIENDIGNKETENNINFYVCPIFASNDEKKPTYFCEENHNNVDKFPGFREGDKIEFFSKQDFLNEIANTVLNFFASAGEKDITVLEQQINEIKKKYSKS